MKANLVIETQNGKVSAQTLIDSVKERWKNEGNKVKDVETADLYYKPEEKKCYYVINGGSEGSFDV